jgi:hypothetical protein
MGSLGAARRSRHSSATHLGMSCRSATCLLAIGLVAAAAVVRAQPLTPDQVPLEELLEVMLVDRNLLAMDARHGGEISERLQLDESLLWLGSRGKVGVAITNRRMLAVATGSGSWNEATYQRSEEPPVAPILGDRVGILITNRRALGVDGDSGNLVEYRLLPRERVIVTQVGANVAVVVTDRVALGLSPIKGGFFPVKLDVAERIESITAVSNVATLTTDRRLLIFRTPTGTWEERNRNLH